MYTTLALGAFLDLLFLTDLGIDLLALLLVFSLTLLVSDSVALLEWHILADLLGLILAFFFVDGLADGLVFASRNPDLEALILIYDLAHSFPLCADQFTVTVLVALLGGLADLVRLLHTFALLYLLTHLLVLTDLFRNILTDLHNHRGVRLHQHYVIILCHSSSDIF